MARLTEQEVREIWGLRGKMIQREIAKKYGVCPDHIKNIYSGKRWPHLKPSE
jgi:uncharacterized protein YjcR